VRVLSVVGEDLPWHPMVNIVYCTDEIPAFRVIVPESVANVDTVMPSPLQKPMPQAAVGVVGTES
jgi:hypothetical protein